MSGDIDFGNLGQGSAIQWRMGKTKFMGVKLEGYLKSSIDASGGVKITGITGSATKDKEVANVWLVFVMEGEEVTSLEAWQLKKIADTMAMSTGAPVDVIFKNVHPTSEEG